MSKFEKGRIVSYNEYGQSLHDIAKKSIDVFLKSDKKTGNYHQKEGCGHKRKTTASEDAETVKAAKWHCTATS